MVKDATGNKAHRLLLTIDPAELALAQANGEWRDSLNVVVFFKGESRRLGCLWHTVDVVMGETDYQRSQTEGVRISMALPDSFNPAAWRAVVYDAGRDKVGSRATGAFREMLKPNGK